MQKSFLELFPELKMSSDYDAILKDAIVTRVANDSTKTKMRFYITFENLVTKRQIWKLEEEIKQQIFKNRQVSVKIIETFHLSALYTPENFFNLYKDSILEDLSKYDTLIFQMFQLSQFTFKDDIVEVKQANNVVYKGREDKYFQVLDKIFSGRAGFVLKFDFIYDEALNPDSLSEDRDIKIRAAVSQIENRANAAAAQKEIAESVEKIPASNEEFDPKLSAAKKEAFRPVSLKRSDRADVIYGKDFEDDTIKISELVDGIGEVALRGQIAALEFRSIKNEKQIVIFTITDFTDSIQAKIFIRDNQVDELSASLKEGAFIKIKGNVGEDKFDHELSISNVFGIMSIPDFTTKRVDTSAKKRVELHCHTKMSDMDGVSDAGSIIKQAKNFGHKAIAITDHGVVQSFCEADHAAGNDPDFKIIYGCEIYLVDDAKPIVRYSKNQPIENKYVIFDIETTGVHASHDRIIEIGAAKYENGQIVDHFSEFINPNVPIPPNITVLTSITDDMVIDADDISVVLPKFLEFSKDCIMVAHNADFDMGFIRAKATELGLEYPKTYMDTIGMAQFLLPTLNNYKLHTVAKALSVTLEHHHRAVDDAECTAKIFAKLIEEFKDHNANTLDDINEMGKPSDEAIMRMHPYHCIVLAKNDIGRINLYRLVSESHLRYYSKVPKIPRTLLEKYREGLIIGSACEAGELFRAILEEKSDEELAKIVSFYDYLEVQPIGNNEFMIKSEKHAATSEEDLRDYNRKIVSLGEEFNKPVVATCDVHFLNPEDEVYRRIIMAGKGFKDADDQAPLFLHTTDEMLDEFDYLGSKKAEEIVITNPNMIADWCDHIYPVRPDKCPPIIENSDGMLREICYNKAHNMYGPDLPVVVTERLERELNSIIGNGYAVMYIIAQKLVWKSNEDGYLVGSRGSVGSSFAATMAGITEVNPLQAHYLCPECYYVDFDSDEVKSYSGRSGCDMPDKDCPVCGHKLSKEGFDIPFETFLGFKGNKEPDIDLNFSGDYQSKAHRYTEVIFGEGQTFKAGTVGTLADKTAYGYIKHYYEEHNVHKRSCEIDRIVKGCVGVRRTTGQHPGGIIVLPVGEEIYSFTPVQHPANDMTTDIITTHFDYHSIDSNLLKLDILGHDDPTMIRMLEDLIGIDATTIPLDDKGVMSLFKDPSALGVTSAELWDDCPMGTLGVPEFGTDFAMGMLVDAKPKEFTDLVRIAGLAHGTDVWLGNAQTLIEEGKATISTCICTRDDIMTYLISMGLESERSFKIMEAVRKGMVAKGKCKDWPEWKADMEAHGVPDWYIWSCEKIKYMFPKAHAAAYVMMAWRIAYCKINYPLAYYAAFFSIRATAFNYEKMCMGKKKLEDILADYKNRKDTLSKKEQDEYKDMRLVQEMYARGFEFLPMDLYKSDARYFQIVDGKLLPPFTSLDGMGDKAAETLKLAAEDGVFSSKEDIRNRGKVSKGTVDKMDELGIIKGLPESDQLSIFDIAF